MKARFSLMTLIITLFMVYPVFPGTIRDDFEDGRLADFWDPLPGLFKDNPDLVQVTDADEHDGTLNLQIEAGKFRTLWIKEPVLGDCEVSIEYSDYLPNVYPSTNIELKFRDAANPEASTFARLGVESGGAQIMVSGMEAGTWIDNQVSGNWSSPEGKMKLIKKGDVVTAVVWDGNKELEIAKEYTFKYDPVIVLVKASSWGNVGVPNIVLDNFELVGSNVPNMGAAVTLKGKLPSAWARIKASVQSK